MVPKSSTPRARQLRRETTDAEALLWSRVRAHRLDGVKFKRQVPIGPYFVDFAAIDAKLIVEVDGGQHADRTVADTARTRLLEQKGVQVLRFWNHDVLANIEGVLRVVRDALKETE
jgi:very-short-patch-repair endonuclease